MWFITVSMVRIVYIFRSMSLLLKAKRVSYSLNHDSY